MIRLVILVVIITWISGQSKLIDSLEKLSLLKMTMTRCDLLYDSRRRAGGS